MKNVRKLKKFMMEGKRKEREGMKNNVITLQMKSGDDIMSEER